jgi:cation diffusion facilitator CzcD-associated flavoprotein CzcO
MSASSNWRWPDIQDIEKFQGDLIHTAKWPQGFDCAGRTIAVIGNGASGLQIVPAIQPAVKQLYHIVRTPTWILPPRIQAWKIMGQAGPILGEIEMDDRENFTPKQIEKFKSDPAFYRKFVKAIEKEVNNTLPIVSGSEDFQSAALTLTPLPQILKDGPVQSFARQHAERYMGAMLRGDAALCKALIPQYPLGARRLTPAPGFFEALAQPNVEAVTSGVKRFVPEGIELESGQILKVDAIICATGFDVSFRPRFPIIGREGNLQDIWEKETPKAYMSCAVQGMPNYFCMCSHSVSPGDAMTNRPYSFPRSKCPNRPWQRLHFDRAHCEVYRERDQEVPNRRH